MRLKLKKLEGLPDSSAEELICAALESLNLDSVEEARKILFAQLQMFEASYKITSEDMFASADCEKRELDPELDRWATLYRCYKEIA
jgi:hypothetical protein